MLTPRLSQRFEFHIGGFTFQAAIVIADRPHFRNVEKQMSLLRDAGQFLITRAAERDVAGLLRLRRRLNEWIGERIALPAQGAVNFLDQRVGQRVFRYAPHFAQFGDVFAKIAPSGAHLYPVESKIADSLLCRKCRRIHNARLRKNLDFRKALVWTKG